MVIATVPTDLPANKLLHIRKELGLTQTDFARELGVSFPTITRWEHRTVEPSMASRIKIVEYLRRLGREDLLD